MCSKCALIFCALSWVIEVLGTKIGSGVFQEQTGAEIEPNSEVPGGGKARRGRDLGAGL